MRAEISNINFGKFNTSYSKFLHLTFFKEFMLSVCYKKYMKLKKEGKSVSFRSVFYRSLAQTFLAPADLTLLQMQLRPKPGFGSRSSAPALLQQLELFWSSGSRLLFAASSQSCVLLAASLRAMILYTLSLKLLSEVSRRAVARSSSMLPSSPLANANDLECCTAEKMKIAQYGLHRRYESERRRSVWEGKSTSVIPPLAAKTPPAPSLNVNNKNVESVSQKSKSETETSVVCFFCRV